MIYRKYFKRLLDLGVAAPLFVATVPFMVLVAAAIRVSSPGPVLFRQLRPGLQGRLFCLHKFRTMTETRGAAGDLLTDAQRLTRLGKWLRRYSLDELPQLWNVLRGDLSLVGPRPLLPEYLPLYNPEQARRHLVKPGITGWAQVNGRNAICWEQKFAYDVWYVDHQSWRLDLKILLLTFKNLVKTADTQAPGSATAERFTGTLPHAC
jgi:lipopolysaccharide/colanic/teichoic acid biosynthesis glycosyltransferase